MVRDRFKKSNATAAMSLYQRGGGGGSLKKRFLEWISSFGKYAMKNKEDTSKLRFSLIQAGYRHPKGPVHLFRAPGPGPLPPGLAVSLIQCHGRRDGFRQYYGIACCWPRSVSIYRPIS